MNRKTEDFYFQVYDVIPAEIVEKWLIYLPADNSLLNPRVYNEVYDDDTLPYSGESVGSEIWSFLQDLLPVCYGDNMLIGRSHRVRFIRELCQNSMTFPKHYDEMETPYPLERYSRYEMTAQLTILIYLNHGFDGGDAHFYVNNQEYRVVKPQAGRFVIFDRRILHCAEPLKSKNSDKLFLKLCALYGHDRAVISPLSESSGSCSNIQILLKSFKEANQIEAKVVRLLSFDLYM